MYANIENSNVNEIAQIQQAIVRKAFASTPSKTASSSSASTPRVGARTPLARTPSVGDRFIPSREAVNFNIAQLDEATCATPRRTISASPASPAVSSSVSDDFSSQLAQSLFDGDALNSKILAFKNKAPKPTVFENTLHGVYSQNAASGAAAPKRAFRHIAAQPERVLDAPGLVDDYYLNLLDWSSQNQVAVALGSSVYLWNAADGSIDELLQLDTSADPNAIVTSVSWMADGSHIAVGTSDNLVQLWSVERKKQVRSMAGHQARVSALAWNNHVLSSGSRDSNIFHHDVRVAQHHFATLKGHTQEICGLKWSHDGTQLASGANDNLCNIWDVTSTGSARFSFNESAAAVKALAWCPWQKNTLATGSGTADRHIRFYNTQAGSLINKIDTNSQVCSLVWSTTEKELLSSHGFSQNQLTVWKFPSLVKVADLTGHSSRVLHTAISPDGTSVCSAAADETMRFWRVWESAAQKQKRRREEEAAGTKGAMMSLKIR